MKDKEKRREYYRRKHEEAELAYAAFISYYPLTLDNLPDEVWKDIDGYGGEYQISTFGRVKSFKWTKPRILKPQLIGEYLRVDLCFDGKTKHQPVHILVAQAFIPNLEGKPEVNHDDGHKFNCHVSNLYWATRAENVQHAVKNGLIKSGEDNYLASVTNEQAKEIRENPDKLTQQQLADKFKVTKTRISEIQTGKRYRNAGGTLREPQKPGAYHRIPDEIREQILADWATGQYSQRALARKFGYSHPTISNIVQG